jgi:alkylhydroperoxidase/carboxymuconolactone decarboxylase family protein YurZ
MADDAQLYDNGLAMRREVLDANGVSREEIQEVLLQTTVYCGVPAALKSFRIAAELLKQEDTKKR